MLKILIKPHEQSTITFKSSCFHAKLLSKVLLSKTKQKVYMGLLNSYVSSAGQRARVPPDPIPNSEVKPCSVSSCSVVLGHVNLGKLATFLLTSKFLSVIWHSFITVLFIVFEKKWCLKVSLIPGSDSITQIISLLSYVFFIVLIFYGQRIQMYVMIREVENSLHKLKHIKEEGRKTAIETLKEIGKPTTDPAARVDRYLDYFTIGPQNMDPAGIVNKLDHVLDVRDERLKEEVRLMAPAVQNDDVQINNLENTLEAAMALNFIYKVVRHYYIQGKKTLSLYVIMQLQMILPMVMKEADAYAAHLKPLPTGNQSEMAQDRWSQANSCMATKYAKCAKIVSLQVFHSKDVQHLFLKQKDPVETSANQAKLSYKS